MELDNYSNVLFDLDNTLYEQWRYDKEIFHHFFLDNDIDKKKAEKFALALALKKANAPLGYNKTFDDFFFEERILLPVSDLVDYYYLPPSVTVLIPNYIRNLLQKLGNKNLILVSNGNLRVQYNKIIALNIGNYFNQIFILSPNSSPKMKPSNEVLKRINLKNGQSVYIGDNLIIDRQFAYNCGFDFIYFDIKNNDRFL
jgi:FMN phosphatase YigB (HAD superfamily)